VRGAETLRLWILRGCVLNVEVRVRVRVPGEEGGGEWMEVGL